MGEGGEQKRGSGTMEKRMKMIYIIVFSVKRGMQLYRCQIMVSGRGQVHGKKGLKMIGTTVIRSKRRIQWDRSQIMGWARPKLQWWNAQILNRKKIVSNGPNVEHEKYFRFPFYVVCVPRLGFFFRVSIDNGLPCAISL
jgi:hypothetical protein